MFTKESFWQMATEAEEKYKRLLIEYPPGTVHRGRNEAYDLMEKALICAEWMEKQGIQEARDVGPFMTTEVARGDKVKIRKGATIHSCHPAIPREGVVSSRIQTVVVDHTFSGYIERGHLRRDGKTQVVQGQIRWAGTGGYWKWVNFDDILSVEKAPANKS